MAAAALSLSSPRTWSAILTKPCSRVLPPVPPSAATAPSTPLRSRAKAMTKAFAAAVSRVCAGEASAGGMVHVTGFAAAVRAEVGFERAGRVWLTRAPRMSVTPERGRVAREGLERDMDEVNPCGGPHAEGGEAVGAKGSCSGHREEGERGRGQGKGVEREMVNEASCAGRATKVERRKRETEEGRQGEGPLQILQRVSRHSLNDKCGSITHQAAGNLGLQYIKTTRVIHITQWSVW